MRYNEPYSGLAGMMYSIHRHATHHGLPCLELEVNQDLFHRKGAAQRLAAAVAQALEPLIAAAAGRPPAAAVRAIDSGATSRRRR